MCIDIYTYIHIHTYVCLCVYSYIYIYMPKLPKKMTRFLFPLGSLYRYIREKNNKKLISIKNIGTK